MRISWTERLTNEEVPIRVGTTRTLLNNIRARQLSSLGHDLRAGDRKDPSPGNDSREKSKRQTTTNILNKLNTTLRRNRDV